MTLKRPAKRRFKYVYCDNARSQLKVKTDVYTMNEAPPGIDCWGDLTGRGPDDTDERRGPLCKNGRDTPGDDDNWRIDYKRGTDWEYSGKDDSAYTGDSKRWTEEDWLYHEQTQNEV